MIGRAVGAACVVAVTAACGHSIFRPPAGPGRPATDASAAWTDATTHCRAATSYSAAVRLSGRAGSQRIRTLSVDLAVMADRIYLNAVYSGQSVLVLAGMADAATLWLRPDPARAVTAPAGDIIEAVLGLPMPPPRLLALVTGCVTQTFDVQSATAYDGLLAIQTQDARVYVESRDARWRTRAGELEGFVVEYGWDTSPLPSRIWIRSAPGREPRAEVNIAVSDAGVNDPIQPSVFMPPAGAANAERMTLDELRANGAWKGRD